MSLSLILIFITSLHFQLYSADPTFFIAEFFSLCFLLIGSTFDYFPFICSCILYWPLWYVMIGFISPFSFLSILLLFLIFLNLQLLLILCIFMPYFSSGVIENRHQYGIVKILINYNWHYCFKIIPLLFLYKKNKI